MFSIAIRIDSSEGLTGLDALDARRALGLPDGSELSFSPRWFRACEVSEGFARAHFERHEVSVRQKIPWKLLAKGDVEYSQYGIRLSESMTDDRIRELWLIARQLRD